MVKSATIHKFTGNKKRHLTFFESYLSCPTKCFLSALNEPKANNAYAAWTSERSRSYRNAGIKNLAASYDPKETVRDAPYDALWASRKSGLAINAAARFQKLETVFHAVEWIAEKREGKPNKAPVPVRFVANNKLSRADKLLLAFDAHVLSKLLNGTVAWAASCTATVFRFKKLKTSEMEREVKKVVGKIAALLSGSEPPSCRLTVIVLNASFMSDAEAGYRKR